VAAGGFENIVRIWDFNKGLLVRNLTNCHNDAIWSLIPLYNGNLLASGSQYELCMWNLSTGEIERRIGVDATNLVALDNGRLASAGNQANIVRLWDTETGYSIRNITVTDYGAILSIAAVRVGDDNEDYLAVSVFDEFMTNKGGEIKVWETSTGALKLTLSEYYSGRPFSLASLPGGQLAIGLGGIYSIDGVVEIWDLASGKLNRTINGHTAQILSMAVFKSGLLASGAADYFIRLWQI
jgi:WD40 repeat protein